MGNLSFAIPVFAGLFLLLRSVGSEHAALILVGVAVFYAILSSVLLRD